MWLPYNSIALNWMSTTVAAFCDASILLDTKFLFIFIEIDEDLHWINNVWYKNINHARLLHLMRIHSSPTTKDPLNALCFLSLCYEYWRDDAMR